MRARSIATVLVAGVSAGCWGERFEPAEDVGSGTGQDPADSTPDSGAPASGGDGATPSSGGAGNAPPGAASGGASTSPGGGAASAPPAAAGAGSPPVVTCVEPNLPALPLSCPPECTGGCQASTCRISCTGDDACKDQAILCPANMHCELACNGKGACEKARIQCGSLHACRIICMGEASCKEATASCGAGSCDVDCRARNACHHTRIHCGTGACSVQGSGAEADCGPSCLCALPEPQSGGDDD